MAKLSQRSRYLNHPTVFREVWKDNESDLSAEPIRRDIVFLRRYTTYIPVEGSSEYVTQAGDTLPGLANRFYKNPQLWWVLADFNPQVFYPLELEANTVLSIPPVSLVGRTESRF